LPLLTLSALATLANQIGGRTAMETVLTIAVLLVALDVAALRWGYDSRDGLRGAGR